MRTTNLLLVSALAFAGLGACTTYAGEQAEASAGETEIMLKGNLVYRERIALPPGSTAIVSLEDVSLADAPSPTIASQTIELDGRQIPIPFMLDVDADELSSRGRYSLRATIHGPDGNLAWTTDTARLFDPAAGDRDFGDVQLVRVAGSGSSVSPDRTAFVCGTTRVAADYSQEGAVIELDGREYALSRVPSGSGTKYERGAPGSNDYALFWERGDSAQLRIGARDYPECSRSMAGAGVLEPGREWVVEDIDGREIIDGSRITIRFSDEGRISGIATCNNYTGTYRIENSRLIVDDELAVTRKMCAPALMQQERLFLSALTGSSMLSRDADRALKITSENGAALRAR